MGRCNKWFQRCFLDAVLHDPPPVVAIVVLGITGVFVLGYWSAQYKGDIAFPGCGSYNIFSDNIGRQSYYDELGKSILPIDVVYTWVNGSDPVLVSGLRSLLRSISTPCNPPHYCAQARYLAAPLRSSTNISLLSSVLQVTPRLAGTHFVTAELAELHKDFLVARVMSRMSVVTERVDNFEDVDRVSSAKRRRRSGRSGEQWMGRQEGKRADEAGTTTAPMTDLDEVLMDLQARLAEAGISVVAGQAQWSTENNHGWSIAKDTAAFVISNSRQDAGALYHKLTHAIPQFHQSCDHQILPSGFFVECLDRLLIEDLREAIIVHNTPQTGGEGQDDRVHYSLRNNVPRLAKADPTAGSSRAALPLDKKHYDNSGSGNRSIRNFEGRKRVAKTRVLQGGEEDSQNRRRRWQTGASVARMTGHNESKKPSDTGSNLEDSKVHINRNAVIQVKKNETLVLNVADRKLHSYVFFNDSFKEGEDGKMTSMRKLLVLAGRFHHKRTTKQVDNELMQQAMADKVVVSKNQGLAFRNWEAPFDLTTKKVPLLKEGKSSTQHPTQHLSVKESVVDPINLSQDIYPRKHDFFSKSLVYSNTTTTTTTTITTVSDLIQAVQLKHQTSALSQMLNDSISLLANPSKIEKVNLRGDKLLLSRISKTNVSSSKISKRGLDSSPDAVPIGDLKFLPAYLLLQVVENDKLRDSVTINRFQDSEELRYSLRSLERYAGWVRRVYLVTNGQIPHWLDLDHSRLTLVPHEDIFPDKTHLPTYSSPAIESHLHRIPGLAPNFLYLNDDVMLGSPVYPHDFYTPEGGQKVFLAWQVPACAPSCANAWLGDGYCDLPCNVTVCSYDGGDCVGENVNMGVGGVGESGDSVDALIDGVYDDDGDDLGHHHLHCSPGCLTSWLADQYCDLVCNVAPCAYDCGDCGVGGLRSLPSLPPIVRNTTLRYTLLHGTTAWWIDLSNVLTPSHTITGEYFVGHSRAAGGSYAIPELKDGEERPSSGVLSLTASNTLKLVVAAMAPDFADTVHLRLVFRDDNTGALDWCTYLVSFNSSVNFVNGSTDVTEVTPSSVHFNFTRFGPEAVLDDQEEQKVLEWEAVADDDRVYHNVDESASSIEHTPLFKEIHRLNELFARGHLTSKGLKVYKYWLVKEYLGRHPEKRKGLVFYSKGFDWIQALNSTFDQIKTSKNSNASDTGRTTVSIETREADAGHRKLLWDIKNIDEIYISKPHNTYYNSDFILSKKFYPQFEDILDYRHSNAFKQSVEGVFETYTGSLPWEKYLGYPKEVKINSITSSDGFDWDAIVSQLKEKLHDNEPSNKDIFAFTSCEKDADCHQGRVETLDTDFGPSVSFDGNSINALGTSFNGQNSNKCLGVDIKNVDNINNSVTFVSRKKVRSYGLSRSSHRKDDSLHLLSPSEISSLESFSPGRRHLLDMFADSLLYVNHLYNEQLGLRLRKVPAHTPHFINVTVMKELQERFLREFSETSSHRVRQSQDMQYAFSYYYYLLGATRQKSLQEIFDDFDTDQSGTWSDRELRTLLSRLGTVPVQYERVQRLHALLHNCSQHHPKLTVVSTPPYERYADSTLPPITSALVHQCPALHTVLQPLRRVPKFLGTETADDNLHFKMITSNVSRVVTALDEVRRQSRKFICLNNNLDPEGSDNSLILALLQDTYEALYPQPSSFELPSHYRNRFLYLHELEQWRRWRDVVRAAVYSCFAVLVFIAATSFCASRIEACRRKCWRRRNTRLSLEKVVINPV